MKRICVFCGVNRGAKPEYEQSAIAMGIALSKRRLGLVYGGTRVGMMGAIADAALAEGGEVIGVIPSSMMAIAMILEETEPERMIDAISQHLPPSINKLLEPD